jgi:hypothetical protein
MSLKELIPLSKKFNKEINSTIKINSISNYERFKQWCKVFNPDNITKVIFSITDYKYKIHSYSINYVPSCVNTVEVLAFNTYCSFESIRMPNTVGTLIVHDTYAMIDRIPDSIRHLVLGYDFKGIVCSIKEAVNLEYVELYGYDSGGRVPCPIELPDTIQILRMYSNFPGYIEHWPVNAKLFVEDPDDYE